MKRFCSILNQTLQLFPRTEFEQAVRETKAERHARGFNSWDHFVAMEFCHLGNAQSLREIEGGPGQLPRPDTAVGDRESTTKIDIVVCE